MKFLFLNIVFSLWLSNLCAQQFSVNFQQCYGGSEGDGGSWLLLNNDSTYTLLCSSTSNDGDVTNNHGKTDFWLVKTDNTGNLLWEKCFGGSDDEGNEGFAKSINQSFILFGDTYSNDGDVAGNHGGSDYWVVKTDTLGNLEWQKCLGSTANDLAADMDIDAEGNIYLIGSSYGNDGDVSDSQGLVDYWIIKLNPEGQILWDKSLGGAWLDYGLCISITDDGGYIAGGWTWSPDRDVLCEPHGEQDVWIVKIDSSNNIEWQQCYGGSEFEAATDIRQTSDGGYIFIANTRSNDGEVSGFHGVPGFTDNDDIWVVKIDITGTIEWESCYGGSDYEAAKFIKITEDGDYIIGGSTRSDDGDVSGNHSEGLNTDLWLFKLSLNGQFIWQQCFGSKDSQNGEDVCILNENEMMLISTALSTDGDVNCNMHGSSDVWLFKIKDNTVGLFEKLYPGSDISLYPNPASDYIIFRTKKSRDHQAIRIYDLWGRLITSLTLTGEATVWNTGKLPNGIYFAHVISNSGQKNIKLVISH